ncbi:MAG: type II toxin-antitoxin system VapC family toxin [Rhodopila sp.]
MRGPQSGLSLRRDRNAGLNGVLAVDTSALIAVLLREERADACMKLLQDASGVAISAATVTEALIVAGGRNIRGEMEAFIDGLALHIEPVTAAFARRAAAAYARWGRGIHPAAFNFGDCFAYALAEYHACPLLFVGNDFGRTDIISALPGT